MKLKLFLFTSLALIASSLLTAQAASAGPIISIISPVTGSSAISGQSIKIEAKPSGGVAPLRVLIFANGNQVCTATVSPYVCNYVVPTGILRANLQAKVIDAVNVNSLSAYVQVSVISGSNPGPITPPPTTPGAPAMCGRFDYTTPSAPRFTWSTTTVEANFVGSAVNVTLDHSKDGIEYVYTVDNNPPKTLKTVVGQKTYTLATGLDAQQHRVQLFRNSEGLFGITKFLGFSYNGGGETLSTPVPPPGPAIEIIGDSITCGYGNIGTPPCVFQPSTQSSYLAYGSQAARLLNSRPPTTICKSGIGVYRNNMAQPNDPAQPTMPMIYNSILFGVSTANGANTYKFPTTSDKQPKVVVINLGTNDFAAGIPVESEFRAAYIAFVKRIRGNYPSAYIILATGPMMQPTGLSALRTYVKNIVASFNNGGDSKVKYLEFPAQDVKLNGVGCNNHPSVKTDTQMAQQLAAFIKTLIP